MILYGGVHQKSLPSGKRRHCREVCAGLIYSEYLQARSLSGNGMLLMESSYASLLEVSTFGDTAKKIIKKPAHAHHYQATVYHAYEVERLLWPGNSLALNAIEPCWNWMKRTTARGASQTRKKMEAA